MSLAIDHAAQFALNKEQITNAALARLLYHQLQTEETSKSHDCAGLL
jgi:hypothetical protein